MNFQRLIIATILFGLAIFVLISCEEGELKKPEPLENSSILSVSPTKTPYSSIRKVDFRNFTFPWTENQMIDSEEFTLKDGEKEMVGEESGASLNNIEYGDITNDEIEEAFISILPETGGNCQCAMIYIYSIQNEKLKLLWMFDTWDGALGGFKRAYEQNNELILEIFGDNNFEQDKWKFSIPEGKFQGLCCPTAYTKFRFNWKGAKFVLKEKPELFDYDWRGRKVKK
ncbi:MAG: hypothetical protein HKN25_03085 [Pyrinomonadaceae bacterium]|nr:hypothetical protein [Pyrinomonadaceae bacterium]